MRVYIFERTISVIFLNYGYNFERITKLLWAESAAHSTGKEMFVNKYEKETNVDKLREYLCLAFQKNGHKINRRRLMNSP